MANRFKRYAGRKKLPVQSKMLKMIIMKCFFLHRGVKDCDVSSDQIRCCSRNTRTFIYFERWLRLR